MFQLLNHPDPTGNQLNTIYLNTQSYRISDADTTIFHLAAFQSILTNETYYVVPASSSGQRNSRYSEMEITLSSIPNGTGLQYNGQLNIGDVEGFFNVTIYEQTTQSNIDPDNAAVKGIVFQGLAYMRNASSEVSFTEYSTTDTNTVYVK